MSAARCPGCGGLVAPDAAWCGQCFRRLEREGPAPGRDPDPRSTPAGSTTGTAAPAGGPFEVRGDRVLWDCPACGSANPIEASTCRRCGTSFARLMEHAAAEGSRTSPGRAMRLSLAFPGLGHAAAGRTAEGAARGVLFLWVLGTLVALIVVRSGRGFGPYLALVLLYALSASGLYAVTAADARRAASGEPPIVSARHLLYGVSGLMLLTVAVLFVVGVRVGP